MVPSPGRWKNTSNPHTCTYYYGCVGWVCYKCFLFVLYMIIASKDISTVHALSKLALKLVQYYDCCWSDLWLSIIWYTLLQCCLDNHINVYIFIMYTPLVTILGVPLNMWILGVLAESRYTKSHTCRYLLETLYVHNVRIL